VIADQLDGAAAGHGLISTGDAARGIIRRVPLVADVNGTLAPALSVEMMRVALQVPGIELGKIVVSGVRAPEAETDALVVFLLHRGELAEFLPLAQRVARRIGEHAGLEVSAVVPVARIPKTTSGKVQRHQLEQEYLDGAYRAELEQLRALASQGGVALDGRSGVEAELQQICDQALGASRVGPNDSLFDVGVSSLTLLAIHEQVEQRWPGAIEVTDIFDHPSIAELARLIEARLEARSTGSSK